MTKNQIINTKCQLADIWFLVTGRSNEKNKWDIKFWTCLMFPSLHQPVTKTQLLMYQTQNVSLREEPRIFLLFSNCNKGTFNNYVDQILSNFDPPSPSSGQKLSFYILSTLCHVTQHGISTDPPLLIHARSYWMIPNNKISQSIFVAVAIWKEERQPWLFSSWITTPTPTLTVIWCLVFGF